MPAVRRSSNASRSANRIPDPAGSLRGISDRNERWFLVALANCLVFGLWPSVFDRSQSLWLVKDQRPKTILLVFVKPATRFLAQPSSLDIALKQRARPIFRIGETIM